MDYGTKIAALRKEKGLSQENLAERLYVSRDLISKWETGKRRPDRTTLAAIAAVFEVDINDFEPTDQRLIRELSSCLPPDTTVREELSSSLNRFLQSLSERDAKVFVRRYYFCETPREIGAKLQIREVSVRMILSRTRKKLRLFFERECM